MKRFLLLLSFLFCATVMSAQNDYYVKQAQSYQREAEYYTKQALGYEREVAYYNRQAQGYFREAEYYSKRQDYERVESYQRRARNATEKGQADRKEPTDDSEQLHDHPVPRQ